MRFFNRSHREGPLGAVLNDATQSTEGEGNLLEQYPNLPEVLGLSDPLHYQPGDVTVHHGYCIHGSPDNTTDKPRWSYLFSVSSHRPLILWFDSPRLRSILRRTRGTSYPKAKRTAAPATMAASAGGWATAIPS